MPTSLTNSRMDPALAARVEASVTGRRTAPGAAPRVRRMISLARLVLVLTAAFAIYSAVTTRQKARTELAQKRLELLEIVQMHAAGVSPTDRGAVTRAEAWLRRLSGAYEGDLVPSELRADGALTAVLARPAIYVRGPIDAFRSPEDIASAAAASAKDALLLCLMHPPAARTERVLLEKVRVAYAGGPSMEEQTANVRRLDEAIVGLPFLQPEWSERVRTVEDAAELARMKRELEHAPIARAKQAAAAKLLVVAIDERGDGKGPTELDGERPHDVRIALVDLAAAKILLRVRKPVDPSWISQAKRPTHASGLDDCALAFDVHADAR
jgi:hypothetical protein